MSLLCLMLLAANAAPEPVDDEVILFSYFVNNGEDGVHLAWSEDGWNFEVLGNGRSYLAPGPVEGTLMRDPSIHRGPDGIYRMVWTSGWERPSIGYAWSRDLLEWHDQQLIEVMENHPGTRNVWAPEIFYDARTNEYLIYWASTIPGRYQAGADTGDDGYNHRMYLTTTRDFQSFTPARLLFNDDFNVIDATIVERDGTYYLILKDETLVPPAKNLRVATSSRATGGYGPAGPAFTDSWVEGPSVIKVGDEYVVYYDYYARGAYGASKSTDLLNWEKIEGDVNLPPRIHHGTALWVPRADVQRLIDAHPAPAAAEDQP